MIPLQCAVNWYDDCSNYPVLEIMVDQIPFLESMRFEHRHFDTQRDLWFAHKDGYVKFFAWSGPENEGGYYGAEFLITLVDGSNVVLKGPWSSRTGIMNQFFIPQCIDAHLNTEDDPYFLAGAVSLPFALSAITLCEEPIQLVVKKLLCLEYFFVPERIEQPRERSKSANLSGHISLS